jgi:galactose mutarotase-like enzyme
MRTYFLENDFLKIEISSTGGELQSVYNKKNQIEYLWQGDAAFWSKRSPVLFPIVGGLKNNSYQYNGEKYELGRHGFAREMVFDVVKIDSQNIKFILIVNRKTRTMYPFDFALVLTYSIENDILTCNYEVENIGYDTMYFSVGGHPAFNVPLGNATQFNDWFLQFGTLEFSSIYPLTSNGLLAEKATPYFNTTSQLQLNKSLFYNDALVFKNLASTRICLLNNINFHGLEFKFKDFPYFGIWSAKDANFICLEPWCGIADSENATGILNKKEGINRIEPKEIWNREWTVQLF